jgi:cytochrome oxidase assembly protein ShyY1
VGRYVAQTVVCLLLAVSCIAAGLWQIHRYGEKRTDNSDLRHNADAPPVGVADLLSTSRPADPALKLRTATATGRYEPAGQVLVRQREVEQRAGFLVVTPLRTPGGVLLVVRGFVPAVGSATQSPPVPPAPAGEVTVTGRVYPSEAPQATAATLPVGQVARIDVAALGRRLGGGPTYGGYLELVSSQPAESAALVAIPAPDLSNPAGGAVEGQHLAYIVQWFFFGLLALAAPILLPILDRRAQQARQPARRGLAEPGPAERRSAGQSLAAAGPDEPRPDEQGEARPDSEPAGQPAPLGTG